MQSPPQVPHGTGLEVWHGFAVSTIVATLTAVKLWLNRKKPNAEVHETESRAERTFAEARRIDADASKSLGEVLVSMSRQLAEAQLTIREDLENKTHAEEVARVRSHKAIAEVQRCVMKIRDYEELLRVNNIPFERFEFKTNEQIMNGK